jgi:hypothetical protein
MNTKKLMGVRNWKRAAQDREKRRGCSAIEEEEGSRNTGVRKNRDRGSQEPITARLRIRILAV